MTFVRRLRPDGFRRGWPPCVPACMNGRCHFCGALGGTDQVTLLGRHHRTDCPYYGGRCKHCGIRGSEEYVTSTGDHHRVSCPRSCQRCPHCGVQNGAPHRQHCPRFWGPCKTCGISGSMRHIMSVGPHHEASCPRYAAQAARLAAFQAFPLPSSLSLPQTPATSKEESWAWPGLPRSEACLRNEAATDGAATLQIYALPSRNGRDSDGTPSHGRFRIQWRDEALATIPRSRSAGGSPKRPAASRILRLGTAEPTSRSYQFSPGSRVSFAHP